MTTQTSRLEGQTSAEAIKAPCKATSDSNLTLSGEQTIDSIACVTGDRVLVKSNTDATENGIYVVSTGDWTRATDFNGARDIVKGTRIYVANGDNEGDYIVSTSNPISIGSSDLTFDFVPVTEITDLSQLNGDSDDITQGATNLYMTLGERSKLAGIQALAEVNDDIVAGANVTVTGGNGAEWTIDAGSGATGFDDLTDVTADASIDGGIYGLQYDTASGGSYDDVLLTDSFYTESEADTLFAGASHTHTLSDITDSGTMAAQDANSVTITGGSVNADTLQAGGSDVLLDSDVGTTVQAFDADILKADVTDELQVGYSYAVYNGGTQTGGTYTPNEANGYKQRIVNGGAFTLAPPANNTNIELHITNNSSAGTIDTSGFTMVTGDTLETSDASEYLCDIYTTTNGTDARSLLNVYSLGTGPVLNGLNLTYDSVQISVASQTTTPRGIELMSDGLTMLVCGDNTPDTIFQYTMGGVNDLSGATYASKSLNVSSQITGSAQGVTSNAAGDRVYVVSSDGFIYQYDLSTAYDISTGSYASKVFDVSSTYTAVHDLQLVNGDSTLYFVDDAASNLVVEATLSTAGDISTASLTGETIDVGGQQGGPSGVAIRSDGLKAIVVDGGTSNVYSMSTAYDASTDSYDSVEDAITDGGGSVNGITLATDNSKAFVIDKLNDVISQYSTS